MSYSSKAKLKCQKHEHTELYCPLEPPSDIHFSSKLLNSNHKTLLIKQAFSVLILQTNIFNGLVVVIEIYNILITYHYERLAIFPKREFYNLHFL